MSKNDKLIIKICKSSIVVFGLFAIFNFILLISGKSYALFTRTVATNDPVIHIETASELPGVPLVDEVKSKLVKYSESSQENFQGGLVAINNEGTLYNETESSQTIREYRYSGSNVNNYVKFNNELWRIVGVFKDGNEEFVKIVRNEELPKEYFPDTYEINNTKYNILHGGEYDYVVNSVYWNKKETGENENNDWSTSGLQYYLNTELDDTKNNEGYLSYLNSSAKNMIRETTYYLGNVDFNYVYIGWGTYDYAAADNTISAYQHENMDTQCSEEISFNSYDAIHDDGSYNCSIWYGNKANWPGKIGLLYASDVGYTSLNSWKNSINHDFVGKSWLDTKYSFWLISPSSNSKESVCVADIVDNGMSVMGVGEGSSGYYTIIDYYSVLPSLYLKAKVKTTSGDGTLLSPYQLKI